jgi:hypothetical protein
MDWINFVFRVSSLNHQITQPEVRLQSISKLKAHIKKRNSISNGKDELEIRIHKIKLMGRKCKLLLVWF